MMKITLTLLATFLMKPPLKWPNLITILLSLALTSPLLIPYWQSLSFSSSTSTTQLGASLISLSLWLTALALLASYPILVTKKNAPLFLLTSTLILLALVASFSMNSLMKFFIAFEATLIPTAMLIMRWGPQPERMLASMYMLMYTLTASLPLLLALIIISHSQVTLSMLLFSPTHSISQKLSLALIIAFLVKLPLYSCHQWLPKAHVEAPVAGSMLLAGILLKLGAYGLYLIMALNLTMTSMKPSLSSLGLIGAIITALMCIRQTDMKALIAYASVSHMSLMVPAMFMDSLWAWHGTFIMLVAHGLTSSGLFAAVNIIYENVKTRNIIMVKALLALSPTMALWWFALLSSNMGCPPFINLPAEMLLILSITAPWTAPNILSLMTLVFFTCAYSLMLYTATSHGPLDKMTNPSTYTDTRTNLLMLMHLLPLLLLILKLTTFSL